MLHLLLLILKIAGIILAIILGILIVLLCIVLFVPVCYQVSGKTDGTEKGTKVRCKVTWLFSLLELKILYGNKSSVFSARIAWKRIKGGERSDEEKGKTDEVCRKVHEEAHEEEEMDTHLETEKETDAPDTQPEPEDFEEPEADEKNPYAYPEDSPPHEEKRSDNIEKNNRIAKKIQKAGEKISSFFQKIKCTIKAICDKINLFSEKKEKLIDFLEDELHRKAFGIGKKALIRLLRGLCPGRGRIFLRYGLGDPALTGTSLAGLAVVYPFLPVEIQIVPEFEEKMFEGKADIHGRLYLIHLLTFALRLLVSKAVRQTYKDVRKFISEF